MTVELPPFGLPLFLIFDGNFMHVKSMGSMVTRCAVINNMIRMMVTVTMIKRVVMGCCHALSMTDTRVLV